MATSLVTTLGLTALANQWTGLSSPTTMTHLAVGSGTTTPALSDTALQTEIVRVSPDTKSVSEGVITVEHYYGTTEGNGTIAEVGLLSASSGGILHVHGQPAAAVTKTTNKTMRITVTLTLSNP
jgi:hypothetical protein